MSSPIVSTDFVITNLSGDLCGEFMKMLSVAAKLQVFFAWAFDEYGNATDEFKAQFASIGVPVGGILWYPTQIIPVGFLLCNGQAVSRTTYASLFAILGTSCGVGDGSTTFNLPNLDGKFLLGSSTSYGVGAVGGEATHTLTEGEMPAHDHTVGSGTKNFTLNPTDGTPTSFPLTNAGIQTHLGGSAASATDETGGSQAHNNMPPYKAGLWLIKY
jgi:microcystin-dependent protein